MSPTALVRRSATTGPLPHKTGNFASLRDLRDLRPHNIGNFASLRDMRDLRPHKIGNFAGLRDLRPPNCKLAQRLADTSAGLAPHKSK